MEFIKSFQFRCPIMRQLPLCQKSSKGEMEIKEYPLTCNRIGRISMKSESSDLVILPSQLKPRKPNMLGFYIFKITSDLNKRWIYCRVIEWSAGERDCYMPTVCVNRIQDDLLVDDELSSYS